MSKLKEAARIFENALVKETEETLALVLKTPQFQEIIKKELQHATLTDDAIVTIGEICKAFGRSRPWVEKFLKAHHITPRGVKGNLPARDNKFYDYGEVRKARNEWLKGVSCG